MEYESPAEMHKTCPILTKKMSLHYQTLAVSQVDFQILRLLFEIASLGAGGGRVRAQITPILIRRNIQTAKSQNTLSFYTRKMVPITGRANSFLEKNMFLKSNINKIHSFFSLFFLPLSPGPIWAVWLIPSSPVLLFFLCQSPWPARAIGSYFILQFCSSIFFFLHGQPELFASDHLLQS